MGNICSCVGIRKERSIDSNIELNSAKVNNIKIARYISYCNKYTFDN